MIYKEELDTFNKILNNLNAPADHTREKNINKIN